jgi:hypothetical protein
MESVPTEKQKKYLVQRLLSKEKAAQRLKWEKTVRLIKHLENALYNDEASAGQSTDPASAKSMRILSPEVRRQRLKLEAFAKKSTEIPSDKLKVAVDLNQTLKKAMNSVIVPDYGDISGKSEQLQATWETDKILDQTLETLGDAVTSITQ